MAAVFRERGGMRSGIEVKKKKKKGVSSCSCCYHYGWFPW
jgi:hypothetical protein